MLGYTTFGTNDLDKAIAFYDELFAVIGAKQIAKMHNGVGYGKDVDKCGFGILQPDDGNPASVGNGSMMAIACASTDIVKELHAKALALGGTCDGAPGYRGDGNVFYGGYFRDLDGNRFVGYFINHAVS